MNPRVYAGGVNSEKGTLLGFTVQDWHVNFTGREEKVTKGEERYGAGGQSRRRLIEEVKAFDTFKVYYHLILAGLVC